MQSTTTFRICACVAALSSAACSGADEAVEQETVGGRDAPETLVETDIGSSAKMEIVEVSPGEVDISVTGVVGEDLELQAELGQLTGDETLAELYQKVIPEELQEESRLAALEAADARVAARAEVASDEAPPEAFEGTPVDKGIETLVDPDTGTLLCLIADDPNEWLSLNNNRTTNITFGWFGDTSLYKTAAYNHYGDDHAFHHNLRKWLNNSWTLVQSQQLFDNEWGWMSTTFKWAHSDTTATDPPRQYDICAFWRFK